MLEWQADVVEVPRPLCYWRQGVRLRAGEAVEEVR